MADFMALPMLSAICRTRSPDWPVALLLKSAPGTTLSLLGVSYSISLHAQGAQSQHAACSGSGVCSLFVVWLNTH